MATETTDGVMSLSILGVPVSAFDGYEGAGRFINGRIISRRPTFCIAINPEKIYRSRTDAGLQRLMASAHIRICDGIGVSIAAMLLYRKRLPRCTGIDLFLRLVRDAAQKGWGIFLLGASPESNNAACERLKREFPGLKISGNQHGYFEDSAAVVRKINGSGADLLFVAMGSPRQEMWISDHMPDLKPPFCMGVGGSLDVVSGVARRAPAVFRATGTEWLYRLLAQPSRFRRQVALPLFALEVLKEFAHG